MNEPDDWDWLTQVKRKRATIQYVTILVVITVAWAVVG